MTDRMRVDRPVDHVEIEEVVCRPAQAGLAMLAQREGRAVRGADLGADDGLMAQAFEGGTEGRLAGAIVVGLGGVEVVASRIDGARAPTVSRRHVALILVAQ